MQSQWRETRGRVILTRRPSSNPSPEGNRSSGIATGGRKEPSTSRATLRDVFTLPHVREQNPEFAGRYVFNGTDPAMTDSREGCRKSWPREACENERDDEAVNVAVDSATCLELEPHAGAVHRVFRSGRQSRTACGGGIFVVFGAGVLVWMQIDNQGKGGLSDAVKKVLLNYFQMVRWRGFPLQWPIAIESCCRAVHSVNSGSGTPPSRL